jgi:hypothetical protein
LPADQKGCNQRNNESMCTWLRQETMSFLLSCWLIHASTLSYEQQGHAVSSHSCLMLIRAEMQRAA